MADLLGNPSALLAIADAPTFLDREIERSLGRAQVEQAQAQTAALQQRMAQGVMEQQQQAQYGREVNAALASGDPRAISALIARYPQYKDALKANWDQMDQIQQRSNMRQAAGIWSALNAGKTDVAINMMESRINADRQAGEDTSDDEEQLALLKSGDPKAINVVKGRLSLFMASVVPDKFASVVEQLGTGTEGARKGQVVGRAIGHYDENGNWVTDYRDPEPGFTLSEGQTRFEPGNTTDQPGDIVSSMLPITMASESGGRDFAADGSILTSPAGAQGRMQVMPGTQADPGFGVAPAQNGSMEEKARVGADYLRAMMERYGGDPAKAWAAYNAGPGRVDAALAQGGDWLSRLPSETRAYVNKNMSQLRRQSGGASSGGGARAVASVPKAPPAPKETARQLTPREVASMNLDPAQTWFMQPNGIPVAVKGGGQQGAYSQSALDAFDRAIGTADRLMKHPGLSSAVGVKGLTGGLLGGWVVPGTDAADFNAELDAMKAQVFLPMVQSMKGMGALSNAEGDKLTAAIGALSTKQSENQFKASLNRIIQDLKTYKQRGMPGGASNAPVRVRSRQEADKLPAGTIYITPNGQLMRR